MDLLNAPAPCLLLRVLPDGSEVLCWPADATTKPDVRARLRHPAIDADVKDLGFDVAGNQLFVVVLQETAEAYADWAARKSQVPWRNLAGDGLWSYDSELGVRPMNVFNGLLRTENPRTRDPVEEAARHYIQAPNVRAVRMYGMSIRAQ